MRCYSCGVLGVVENTDRCSSCLNLVNIFRNAVMIYELRKEANRRQSEDIRNKILEK